MKIARPVLILMTPRSGSSMVASIFAAHGLWHGTGRAADEHNPHGYFENKPIRDVLVRGYGHLRELHGQPVEGRAAARYALALALRRDGYPGGEWFWKGSALYWRAFEHLNPYIVTVRRNPLAVLASVASSKRMAIDAADYREAIVSHNTEMDRVEAAGAARIDAQAVVDGDLSSLKDAFEHCEIPFLAHLAKENIHPEHWHHRRTA